MGSTNTIAIDLRSGGPSSPALVAPGRVRRRIARCWQHRAVHHALSQGPDRRARRRADPPDRIAARSRLRLLAERKQTILRSIESQGKLTAELAAEIEAADSTKRLEDLYLPFKPKKQTLATVARERGLEPLAEEVLAAAPACADLDARAADFVNPDRGVTSAADALLGVGHILAEGLSERADLRQKLRQDSQSHRQAGQLARARPTKNWRRASAITSSSASCCERVPPHRVLAINRGEKAKVLRVKIEADLDAMQAAVDELVVPADHPHADFLRGCGRDALARLVFPSLEREVRRELTDWAETHAVDVFARNLRNLLLQTPVRGRRVLAIDPGFKSGCKLAALDEFGNLLDQAVIHLVGKPERKHEGRAKLVEMIKQHQLTVVAIGNGTACRETEELMSDMLADELADAGVAYVIVNEAGASVYSTSPLGREEFPEYDATLRGAISIGRRMQDPLSELVKIDPASIGVGMYQHDVKAKHLRTSLDAVVESCVNYVGVDLNTASPALLRYVSGLNQLTARRLYDYRDAARSVSQSRAAQGSARLRRGGVRAGGRLSEDRRRRQSARRHLDSSGKLPAGAAGAGEAGLHAGRIWPRRRPRPRIAERAAQLRARRAGRATRRRRPAAARHPGAAGPARPRPARGPAAADLQEGRHQARRPDARHGAAGHGAQRGRLRRVRRHRPARHRPGAHQPAGQQVRPRSARRGVGRRHREGLGPRDRQDAPPRVADDDRAGHASGPRRRSARDKRKRRRQARPPAPRRPPQAPAQATLRRPRAAAGEPRPPPRRPSPGAARRRRSVVRNRAVRSTAARAAVRRRPAPPKPNFKPRTERKPKPKPLVPLTNEMKAGKEPLRTFGDLKQFFELKTDSRHAAARVPLRG